MNTSTTKIQNSSSLTDQAEAIYTALEQATSILDMLAAKYIKTPDYPIFMAIEDELLGMAKQQLNKLIGELPTYKAESTLKSFSCDHNSVLHGVVTNAHSLLALNKAISEWAGTQCIDGTNSSQLNSGHILSLAELAADTAQTIIDIADNGFIEEVAA